MGKKNAKGTQKVTPITDASIASPPYETAMGMSNTEEIKRGKRNKNVNLHSCKCDNKKTNNAPRYTRTWESLTNLYGDADTTEVWDNEEKKPKAMFRSKLQQQENPQEIIEKSRKPMKKLKNKPIKLSLLSLYRKRKNNDNKVKIELNEGSKDTDIKYLPYTEPTLQFKLKKKHKKRFKDHYATGDICMEGPCREALENLYNLQGLKYTPNINEIYKKEEVTKSGNKDNKKKEKKNTKDKKVIKKPKNKKTEAIMTTKDRNVGYGDQISPIPLRNQDSVDVQCKCSFIGKMMRRAICKCNDNNVHTLQKTTNVNNQTREPFLEMKVNSTDMRVINSSEVNKKVRKLGKLEKTESCICPSNKRRLNDGNVCEKGLCEKALKNNHTHFRCNCQKHNTMEINEMKCTDSTCDLQFQGIPTKSRKKKKSKSPRHNETNKPLFEVMLDPINMNIINSNEVKDIIKNTSQNKIICPTGICNTVSKQKNVYFNCKCVSKKLNPLVNKCGEKTCRDRKKCRLSYLCSRVFSKSENRTIVDENRKRQRIRGNGYDTNFRTGDSIVRSHTHKRNGVMINLPRGQIKKGTYVGGRLTDAWSKCFCECAVKRPKPKTKPPKPLKKVPKKVPKRKRRRRGFFRKKKRDHRTVSDKILDCLEREEEKCEKKVQKKSKEYKIYEKKAIKENKKIKKEQEAALKTSHTNWNCVTNFISGVLNVSLETVKTSFKIIFSLIGDPIGSFVYVKEKSKDPPAAIIRVYEWFLRHWKNRTSAIAKRIEESSTMAVIADQIEDSAICHALFAAKLKTPAERRLYESRIRMRRRRIQKRQDEALYGCRHMILTTMRKTPCLWFYHICPDFYPQCLSLVGFMNNFFHVIFYLVAILCWTPCIVACEMFRACMCCFFCTH